MDKDELLGKAKDPKNIPGIYNYCDRWCERCQFTSRCLNHDLNDDKNLDERDLSNEMFWNKIMETLQATFALIKKMAEEEGIDLDNVEPLEEKEEENIVHILSPVSRNYADMVENWMQGNDQFLEYELAEQNPSTNLRLVQPKLENIPVPLKDIIEIIRWYQYQIHVKIRRAIHSRIDEDKFTMDDFPKDSDGSAKVALIGIDRSISAWGELTGHIPGKKQEIVRIIEFLARLRSMTEKEFPEARSFIRPGFEEEVVKSE